MSSVLPPPDIHQTGGTGAGANPGGTVPSYGFTAVGFAAVVAAAPAARATTIDFGGLADGTAVTSEYPGVVLSPQGLPDSDGPPTINTYHNGTGLANSTNPDYPTANILDIAFTAPVSRLSFTFTNFDTGAPTSCTAFNAGDSAVSGGDVQFVSPPSSFQLITVAGQRYYRPAAQQ